MKKTITLIITSCLLVACNSKSSLEAIAEQENKTHQRYDKILKEKLTNLNFLIDESTNPKNVTSKQKIKLGHTLFFDSRLSKDGNISCNSCHNLKTYGVDNLPTSPGDNGTLGDRNSPTVLNASKHRFQFWDGRAKDVEEQAGMPILNPVEMAIPSKEFLVERLKTIPRYQKMFAKAYPNEDEPINYENIEKAIGVFERELNTLTPFDDYLKGNRKALTIEQKQGAALFIDSKCNTCHNGNLFGGNQFQKFGVHQDYWTLTGSKHIDKGRFTNTQEPTDMYVFKVPSLRNITKTAPYFHDGSVKTLEKAVEVMGKTQLNKNFNPEEVKQIVAFLNSLTGEIKSEYKEAPLYLQFGM